MSLADTFEHAGIVLGSMLMVALPMSLVLQGVAETTTPWWGPFLLLAPGFVLGWTVATEQAPFDYDSVWFVCLTGYLLAAVTLAALSLQPPNEHRPAALAVLVVAFGVSAIVDYYWR